MVITADTACFSEASARLSIDCLVEESCPMLVLTRKRHQTLVIGDDIRIVVGKVSCGRVSLLVDAPSGVSIDRGEVWLRKQIGPAPVGVSESRRPH